MSSGSGRARTRDHEIRVASGSAVLQKVFHFDCAREVYTADACVISCFDARFEVAIHKFLKRREILIYDHVKIPGSVKALAAPEREGDRDHVLRMMRTSLRLHRPERALLLGHNDCGAYPGAPPEAIAADVLRAADVVRANQRELQIECYFADFDGIYRIG